MNNKILLSCEEADGGYLQQENSSALPLYSSFVQFAHLVMLVMRQFHKICSLNISARAPMRNRINVEGLL
jgi:hypothetical protein